MENKSNKGLIGLVVVLIIMVLGLGGYIVYDKVLKVENKNKANTQENNEKVYKVEDYEYLMNELYHTEEEIDSYRILRTHGDTLRDATIYTAGFDVNKIGEYERGRLVTDIYTGNIESLPTADDNNSYLLDVDVYDKYTKKLFGPSYTYKLPTKNSSDEKSIWTFMYNVKYKKYYISTGAGFGTAPATYLYNKINLVTKDNNKIILNVSRFVGEFDSENEDYFYNYFGKSNKKLFTEKKETPESLKIYNKLFDEYESDAYQYNFTFVKDTDNKYYISRVDEIK